MPRKSTAKLPAVAPPETTAAQSIDEVLAAAGVAPAAPGERAGIQYRELPLAIVARSPLNPRQTQRSPESIESLGQSIAAKGVLQPIMVRPAPQLDIEDAITGGERFEIVFGEGRYLGASLAVFRGWLPADYAIPARVRDCTDDELVILAAIENLDREDMEPLDEAQLFAALRPRVTPNDGETREAAIARLLNNSVSERTVFRRLALLRLVPEAKEALARKEITLGQAQALSLGAEQRQREILPVATGAAPPHFRVGPDPDDIREFVLDDRPPLAAAVFAAALYEGEIVDDPITGERFFADAGEFDRLQLAALEAHAEKLRARAKWEWVEVLKPGDSFWQAYAERDPSTYEDYKPADPGVGAIVILDDGRGGPKITVKAPVMRKAEADAAVKARKAGYPKGEAPEAGRDPLSKDQQAQLHAAKTRTLRRIVAGDDSLAMALAILGLLGAREVKLGAEGYPIGPSAENRIDSPPENLAAIGALLDKARAPRLPRDQKALAGDWHPHAGLDLDGDGAQLAWLDAIMELPGAELRRLFALLVAERVGSWYLPNNQGWGRQVAEIGDTPLAAGIAGWVADDSAPAHRQVDPADWAPDAAFFKGYPKDRLLDLARIRNVKTHPPHNLAGIRKGELVALLAAEPAGFWTPDLFPECRFQSEKAARDAVAGGGVPLASLFPFAGIVPAAGDQEGRDQGSGIRDQDAAAPAEADLVDPRHLFTHPSIVREVCEDHPADRVPATDPRNDRGWLDAFPLLRGGGELRRNEPTKRFYVDGKGGLTENRIKRLEDGGFIRRVGVDTYALPEVEARPEATPAAAGGDPLDDPVTAAERQAERLGLPT